MWISIVFICTFIPLNYIGCNKHFRFSIWQCKLTGSKRRCRHARRRGLTQRTKLLVFGLELTVTHHNRYHVGDTRKYNTYDSLSILPIHMALIRLTVPMLARSTVSSAWNGEGCRRFCLFNATMGYADFNQVKYFAVMNRWLKVLSSVARESHFSAESD